MAHDQQPRIIGIENEWSIVYEDPDDATLYIPIDRNEIDMLIKNHLPEDLQTTTNGMLSNGARLYKDPIGFLETATAEERSIGEAVVSELAGERMVASMVQRAVEMEDLPASTRINKRVVADYVPDKPTEFDPTWGYHVSFSADADRLSIDASRMLPLAVHLATMNIYAGAGILRRSNKDVAYAIGQKTLNLNETFGAASCGSTQPLVGLRDEHHAEDFIRLHVTSMDPHISPWATRLSIGTTAIIVRLMENGYLAREIAQSSETPFFTIARQVATDPDLKREYKVASGRRLSALDMQYYLYAKAEHLNLTDEEQDIMREWKYALDTLARNPADLLEADWVMRLKIIQSKIEKSETGLYSNTAQLWNDEYDLIYVQPRIDARGNIRPRLVDILRGRTFIDHMPTEISINDRIASPPAETRAAIRARLIGQFSMKKDFSASWDRVAYKDEKGKYHVFNLSDPYDSMNRHETTQNYDDDTDYNVPIPY